MDILKRVREINENITIRMATIDDVPKLTSLFNKTYTRHKTDDYFVWQFFSCPHPATMVLALDGKEIAGCLGVSILTLKDGRKIGFDVDLIVDIPYQRRGLFMLLEEQVCSFARNHKAAFITSLPNEAGNNAKFNAGWTTLGTITCWRCGSGEYHPAKNESLCGNGLAFSKNYPWRFFENPLHTYQVYEIDKDNFCITKRFEDLVDIVDYQYNDVNKLIELFNWARQNTVETWATTPDMESLLLKMGFYPADRHPRYFCAKPLSSQIPTPLSTWSLVPSDSEVY